MARIKHIEIAGKDGIALQSFYRDLFNWRIEPHERDSAYGLIETNGPTSAGIRHEPEGCAELVIYIEVEDVDQAVANAERLGAGVRIPPMTHGDLRFALITDPEGNPIGLTQAPA